MTEDELYEMSNFKSQTTGLPDNIEIWIRTDLDNHGHSRYRLKVKKNREWAGIFLVSKNPKIVKDINNSLKTKEINEINEWISKYSSLIISLIDDKIDSGEFAFEIQKLRNM